MTKRLFSVMLVCVLTVAMIASGCSFSSAMQQLEKYAPIGLNAFSQVVAILLEAGVIQPGMATSLSAGAAKGTGVLGDLQAALAAYNSAPASEKSTKLGAVITALNVADTSLGQFEKDLGVNSANSAVIAAQAGLVVITTTLGSIAAQLVPPANGPAALARAVKANKVDAKAFKKQFNAAMISHGYPQHTI